MYTLLVTPQGKPTPTTVGISHALVGVAGLAIASGLGIPKSGPLVAVCLMLLHGYFDAPLADAMADVLA